MLSSNGSINQLMLSGNINTMQFSRMSTLKSRILKKVSYISRFRFWNGKSESIYSQHVRNLIGQNLVKTHQCVRHEK